VAEYDALVALRGPMVAVTVPAWPGATVMRSPTCSEMDVGLYCRLPTGRPAPLKLTDPPRCVTFARLKNVVVAGVVVVVVVVAAAVVVVVAVAVAAVVVVAVIVVIVVVVATDVLVKKDDED
jgi:hypothetical protein